MPRLLTVSRAARLVGVSRGTLQQQIQDGVLPSFEGMLDIDDLTRAYPQVQLELLANEGCLIQCPFKLTHDAHIALAKIGINTDTFRMNTEFGCIHVLNKNPEQLFKSPFIRPEDIGNYEQYIDTIKLCGRTLGPDFLMQTLKAYITGHHYGNLLDILDTLEWLSPKIHIANNDLPADFFTTVT